MKMQSFRKRLNPTLSFVSMTDDFRVSTKYYYCFCYRYEFEVPLPGTYYWHSHAGFQRGDGIFGSLIVREPKETSKAQVIYDHDLPEHELIIWDWLADLSLSNFLNHHHADGDNKPRGVLINGRGIPPGFFDDFEANEVKIVCYIKFL